MFYRAVNAEPDPIDFGGSLWVARVDGTRAHQITTELARPAPWARWSPDGRTILFASERLQPSGAVYTVRPDGSRLTTIFHDPHGRFPLSPAWSPDGRSIAFALDPTNDAFSHPPNGRYVMTADGHQLHLLVGTSDFKRDPEWYQP